MEPEYKFAFPYFDPPNSLRQRIKNTLRYGLPALLLLCFVLLFSNCENAEAEHSPDAYIGGEIVNPTLGYLVLKHNGHLIDTIRLNDKNRFSYKINNAKEGLYLLHHKPEVQNIYLKPGDSLLLRANTLAFDESLHFSGKGSKRNNFMAEMFLEDEGNSQLLLSFHEYTPAAFLQKADSIKQNRIAQLEAASKKSNFSPEFVDLAQDVINYENNDLKERYTYLVTKYYKEYSRQFPVDFHNYRENIDFNSEALQCSPGYKRLLENYFINQSLAWCATSELDVSDCYSLTNVENIKARLRKIGELVTLPTLKEHLLEKVAVRGIVTASSREDIIDILQELKAQEMDEEDLEEMRQLGTIQLAYLPGTSLLNVPFLNMAGEIIRLEDILEKPTVLFLWSVYDDQHQEEHRLVKEYRKKYPELNFIGINLDLAEEPAWRVAVRQNNYDVSSEYQLATTRIKKEFFTYFLDKILLLNASGEVEVGDIYLTSPELETRLLEFLNQ